MGNKQKLAEIKVAASTGLATQRLRTWGWKEVPQPGGGYKMVPVSKVPQTEFTLQLETPNTNGPVGFNVGGFAKLFIPTKGNGQLAVATGAVFGLFINLTERARLGFNIRTGYILAKKNSDGVNDNYGQDHSGIYAEPRFTLGFRIKDYMALTLYGGAYFTMGRGHSADQAKFAINTLNGFGAIFGLELSFYMTVHKRTLLTSIDELSPISSE